MSRAKDTGAGAPSARSVLVTGGAGYIGSHVVWALHDAGWQVAVVDDLSTGRRTNLPTVLPFVHGDAGDAVALASASAQLAAPPAAIVHFAASLSVPESVEKPLDYYRNNVGTSLGLLRFAVDRKIPGLVFSSTAAVYGMPDRLPVDEEAPKAPLSPYGHSKAAVEQIIRDAETAHGLRHVILRYFNVAGADPAGRTGPGGHASQHLLKVACDAALDRRPSVPVFGDDYATADGTCIRDYIHVADVASGHVAALEHLVAGGTSLILNLGYGHGYSVLEMLSAVERVAGRSLAVERKPRRVGDAPAVVASTDRLSRHLRWTPRYDTLDRMVADALAWEARQGGGPIAVGSAVRSGSRRVGPRQESTLVD